MAGVQVACRRTGGLEQNIPCLPKASGLSCARKAQLRKGDGSNPLGAKLGLDPAGSEQSQRDDGSNTMVFAAICFVTEKEECYQSRGRLRTAVVRGGIALGAATPRVLRQRMM